MLAWIHLLLYTELQPSAENMIYCGVIGSSTIVGRGPKKGIYRYIVLGPVLSLLDEGSEYRQMSHTTVRRFEMYRHTNHEPAGHHDNDDARRMRRAVC